MVRLAFPPPRRRPRPVFVTMPAGSTLWRIFRPRFGMTARTFREYGPTDRWDHHHGFPTRAAVDRQHRGVYYAALSLEACTAEVFGADGVVDTTERFLALPLLRRDVRLLDLRGNGAMRAGTVAALTKVDDYLLTQAWSRFFYKRGDLYTAIDGLFWYSAYNDAPCVVLYERARDAVQCPDTQVMALDEPLLRAEVKAAADAVNLLLL